MRIGIIGAGAIGGWLGVKLANSGHNVSVLARGATLAALTRGTWRLQEAGKLLEARVNASENPSALGPQDLLILAVKGPALAALEPAIQAMTNSDTVILPAMNGVPWWFLLDSPDPGLRQPLESVDPGGRLTRALPTDQVVGCVVYTSATTPMPGLTTVVTGNKLIIGEPAGPPSARAAELARVLSEAGIEAVLSPRIKYEIWYKLWGNMTVNPISAITGATSDLILDDPLASSFILAVMAEAQAIGEHIGISITERGEDRNAVTRSWGAFKTSMLQDAEAGRSLELDALVAAPREIALRLGMTTPALDALLGLARVFARQRGLYPKDPTINVDAA